VAGGFQDFRNLTVYDVGARQWVSQVATGAAPGGRRGACSVSVQGPNGTHEMLDLHHRHHHP
ncbi:MAG TPA: hypothetical protein VGC05_03200, partial [Mycobacterium sp.]